MNNESVGKKIVEALKKQAENANINEVTDTTLFESPANDFMHNPETSNDDDFFAETKSESANSSNFFDDIEEEKEPLFMTDPQRQSSESDINADNFEMPSNIAVLRKLISQLPSGVSRHTGAQIIKQTMEALGISMKSVLQDAQQVQEGLKSSARECQGTIQEYKKQILALEKQSQNYQKQYSALNDLISLFIQTTK